MEKIFILNNKILIMDNSSLEIAKQFLGKKVHLVFDRPLGTKHPKHGFVYESNYGYLPGVMAPDGEELDAYYLGVDIALKEADGVVRAIIHRDNDDDDKLVVAPEGIDISDEQIIKDTYFQEKWFKSSIVR